MISARSSLTPAHRIVLALACAALSFAGSPATSQALTAGSGTRQPVLVELFTSEGCSSCPPADALLARLDATQFVPNAQAIVLSEHVTYWNDLGWRDPFSQEAFTDRQHQYADRLKLQSVYTPQVVVDGVADVLGSDPVALTRQVTRAAATPKPTLTIETATFGGNTLHFAVRTAEPLHAHLMAVLAEDTTQSSVARGENAGRTLHHVAVVRVLRNMGLNAADGRPLKLDLSAKDLPADHAKPLRLVVFLADAHTGQVQAVAESPVSR